MARPGQGSGWGLGLVPQAPRSSGHTASAPGPSPDTDLWDRGITIKPAVRTTQMVAQDDSRTNTHRHTCTQIQIYLDIHTSTYLYLFTQISTEIHILKQIMTLTQTKILVFKMLNIKDENFLESMKSCTCHL